jgi:Alcohol dehydrogenase GroES-like domain
MKAAAYTQYGPPDVVQIMDVEKPVPKDNEVLIKVRAASVNPADWRLMGGAPYVFRVLFRLRKPTPAEPGRLGHDVAGAVEVVGRNVTRFKPGDPVFGTCRGALAEYACASESALIGKPEKLTFEEAASVPVAALTALQGLRDKGRIQPGHKVLINGAGGRCGHVRGADRQVVRRGGDRRLRHEECGHGAIPRRGPRYRLHPGGFHQERATIRPDSRQRGEPFVVRLEGRPESQGHLCDRRSAQEPFRIRPHSYGCSTCVVALREPAVPHVHRENEQRRPDHHPRTHGYRKSETGHRQALQAE